MDPYALFLPARRRAIAVLAVALSVCLSVCLSVTSRSSIEMAEGTRLALSKLWPCASVCLSVTSRSSIETAEGIRLAFSTGASFDPSYSVYCVRPATQWPVLSVDNTCDVRQLAYRSLSSIE